MVNMILLGLGMNEIPVGLLITYHIYSKTHVDYDKNISIYRKSPNHTTTSCTVLKFYTSNSKWRKILLYILNPASDIVQWNLRS